jgi:hypothetical protein
MKRRTANGQHKTKAQLLPLPRAHVEHLQLKYHLALATLTTGQGGKRQLADLQSALAVAFFLCEPPARSETLCLLQRADSALVDWAARIENSNTWTLNENERRAIEALLRFHDAQLATVATHRYLPAREREQLNAARRPFPYLRETPGQSPPTHIVRPGAHHESSPADEIGAMARDASIFEQDKGRLDGSMQRRVTPGGRRSRSPA